MKFPLPPATRSFSSRTRAAHVGATAQAGISFPGSESGSGQGLGSGYRYLANLPRKQGHASHSIFLSSALQSIMGASVGKEHAGQQEDQEQLREREIESRLTRLFLP